MKKKQVSFVKTPSYREAEDILNNFQPSNERYMRFLVSDFFGADIATNSEYRTLYGLGKRIYVLSKEIMKHKKVKIIPNKPESLEQLSLFQ